MGGRRQPSHEQRHEQPDHQQPADHPEFLAHSREDEIGVLVRDERALGVGTFKQSLPRHATGADRDQRLLHVVADALRIGARIQERGEAGDLVGVQGPGHVSAHRQHRSRTQHHQQEPPPYARHEQHPQHRGQRDQGGTQVRLQKKQQGHHSRRGQNSDHSPRFRRIVGTTHARPVGQPQCCKQDDEDLGELRGLQRESARQREPRTGAVNRGPQRSQHGQQAEQTACVPEDRDEHQRGPVQPVDQPGGHATEDHEQGLADREVTRRVPV